MFLWFKKTSEIQSWQVAHPTDHVMKPSNWLLHCSSPWCHTRMTSPWTLEQIASFTGSEESFSRTRLDGENGRWAWKVDCKILDFWCFFCLGKDVYTVLNKSVKERYFFWFLGGLVVFVWCLFDEVATNHSRKWLLKGQWNGPIFRGPTCVRSRFLKPWVFWVIVESSGPVQDWNSRPH